MARLRVVKINTVTEHELVLRLIPLLSAGGSKHVGVALDELNKLFRQHFSKSVYKTLEALVQEKAVVVALIESISAPIDDNSHKARLVDILVKIPKTIPNGKRIRVYLYGKLPNRFQDGFKKYERSKMVLQQALG